MKKLIVEPGACGLKTVVEANGRSKRELHLTVRSACPHIQAMCDAVGPDINPMKCVLVHPGEDPFSEWAGDPANRFPLHGSCPTISGIIKAIEAEAGLGLPVQASIRFIDSDAD